MTKYIDADRLRAELTDRVELFKELSSETINPIRIDECKQIIDIIDSLQQDETQLDKILCSQVWWEEQGWIMIPPDATIEGIDSLLRQVKKKLQQEQPELPGYDKALLDVKSKVDELYEEASIGLSEYDSGLYNGIAETCMKLRGFIKARLHSDEQPEVDIEKEIDEHAVYMPHGEFASDNEIIEDMEWARKEFRHFYALGMLNARKEENK